MESDSPPEPTAGSVTRLNNRSSKLTLGVPSSTRFNSSSPPLSIGQRQSVGGAIQKASPSNQQPPSAGVALTPGKGRGRGAIAASNASAVAGAVGGRGRGHSDQRRDLQERTAPLVLPARKTPTPPVPVSLETSTAAESGDEENNDRIVIKCRDGSHMSKETCKDARKAIEAELYALLRNRTEMPVFVNDWQIKRGGLVVSLPADDLTPSGNRLIRLINERVQVHGRQLKADWNYNLSLIAIMTVRFSSSGDPRELLEDPDIGVVRMNRWPAHLEGQIRYLKVKNEEGSNYRLARFEAPEEVVGLIKAKDGFIRFGFELGTVQSAKQPVKGDVVVQYRVQK